MVVSAEVQPGREAAAAEPQSDMRIKLVRRHPGGDYAARAQTSSRAVY
jgi:hypothetical protein